jgi:thiamine biosynthesis lipoprotein
VADATERVTAFAARAMGSPLRLTLGARASRADETAHWWRAVVDEFEAAEDAMSRFRETSEVTTLNRLAGSGIAAQPSARLRQALVVSDRARRITDGRFDPRVLADLDRLGYRGAPIDQGPVASPPADRDARPVGRPAADEPVVERVGRDHLTLGTAVDLGGIGKGLTLRWAAATLSARGAEDFLLEAGGDLVARGQSPEAGPWRLGIDDPAGGPEPVAVIAVDDLAVATSSTRINRWMVDGREVHHLLDPRTGEPFDGGLLSVTVAAADPAWAEVWSKVLFLDGRVGIAPEARSRGLTAWWVAEDGALEMTPAARAMTIWVAGEAAPAD